MDRIRLDDYDAPKFPGATVGRFHTRGESIWGGAPKMPIGTARSPNFEDFTNPKEPQTTKTHHLVVVIRQIGQASHRADFNRILNLALGRRFRQSGNGGFSCAGRFFPGDKSENKGGKRR